MDCSSQSAEPPPKQIITNAKSFHRSFMWADGKQRNKVASECLLEHADPSLHVEPLQRGNLSGRALHHTGAGAPVWK